MSAIEASTNVLIGYLVSVAANIIILPLFGYNVTIGDSFAIGLAFTAVSLFRSYVLRRAFNWIGS
jgi:acetyltransferase-like isoleucine patch superfamily enzyme